MINKDIKIVFGVQLNAFRVAVETMSTVNVEMERRNVVLEVSHSPKITRN